MDDCSFTETLDWLAFTVPQATVDEIGPVAGGERFEAPTVFRGYPTCSLTNQGRRGVGELGTGAPRKAHEVHVDLSGVIVSTWDEAKIRSVLTWVFARGGHVTRMDVALDDRAAGVSIAQIKQAMDAGQAVTRSQKFQVLAGSSLRDGASTGDTLYFGSRESQTMLRVYDKRLELEQKGREEAKDYGVRWELELKKDRAQACAKALLTLEPDDWREFLVGVLRSYVDFRETTHEAEPWEKYRAPLLSWWASLTEGFKRCRLVVEKIQQTLDEVCQWLGQSISSMLALAYFHRGEQFLQQLIYAGSKKWKDRHLAMLHEGRSQRPYVLRHM